MPQVSKVHQKQLLKSLKIKQSIHDLREERASGMLKENQEEQTIKDNNLNSNFDIIKKIGILSERDGDRSIQNHLSQKVVCESPDNSSAINFSLPENAQNRVGRWTHKELNNLKMAMTLFGDQAWRKIQRFLIQRDNESRKSRHIKKERTNKSPGVCASSITSINQQHTYRSVKAIQSKIYQIKSDVEKENEEFEFLRVSLLQCKKK